MPSVVMKDGTRKTVVTIPFTAPTPPAARRPKMTPIQIGSPSPSGEGAAVRYMMIGERANTRPIERSISPQMSSITSPAAISASGAMYSAMFLMLAPW